MKMVVRYEGGLGDCLLANRFLFALREKYADDTIRILFDTDGNGYQEQVLRQLWPSIYENSMTLPKRKSKEFKINTMVGLENYPAHLDNMPDEFHKEVQNADKFYDLHIDGLKWINYDFDWRRYYFFFPRPEKKPLDVSKYDLPKDFVLTHLYARKDGPNNLDKEYAKQVINQIAKNHNVVAICNTEYFDFYNDIDCKLIDPSFVECFDIAEKCKLFLGIDSGIRYIPLHFGKPTFVFSKMCKEYGNIHFAQLVRWLLFDKFVFPYGFDKDLISKIIDNIFENQLYSLFPYVLSNIDSLTFNRYGLGYLK